MKEFDLSIDEEKRFLAPWLLAKNEEEGIYFLAKWPGEEIGEKYLFSKDEILYCAIDIDGRRESSGALKGAAIGGLVFGQFGAIAAAIIGKETKEKTKKIVLYVGKKSVEPIEMHYKSDVGILDGQKETILKIYHLFSSFAEQNKRIN